MTTISTRPAYSSLAKDFMAIVESGSIRTLFQPIIALKDGVVLGYEALSRGPAGSHLESPNVLFALSEDLGLAWELEYTCRRLAIERFGAFRDDKLLFLNVNPRIIADPRFRDGMTKTQLAESSVPPSLVVLELTEKTAIRNFTEFSGLLEHYKSQGFRLAIDDCGSGYSGLNLICNIKPKYLKLDMNLIRDIHLDAFKQQMIKFTVDFARATDISLIAEGIEQEAELLTLLDLGVEYGQGFYLAKPEPTLETLSPEMMDRLRDNHKRRLANRLRLIVTSHVGDFCRAKVAMQPDVACHDLEALFASDETLMGVPIVEDGVPVGLVMRERLYMRLGRQYGYSLFHNRAVCHIMDPSPLIVDFNDPLEAVAQAAMQRDRLWLYDHIIVTINGMYFGVITVRDLLERITDQGIKYAQYSNPLTGLPGNVIIERELLRTLNRDGDFSVFYVDLDNFKAYNDAYGFDRGDEVLKFTASLLQETFAFGRADEGVFIGHIGGDDFIVVLETLPPEDIIEDFIERFDEKIATYYDAEHRAQQYITSLNRRGKVERFPFISVSIAVVSSKNGPFENYHDLAKRATEVKKFCKAISGSCHVLDRRSMLDMVELDPIPMPERRINTLIGA